MVKTLNFSLYNFRTGKKEKVMMTVEQAGIMLSSMLSPLAKMSVE